jgi:FkbM family methyltransferase
MPILFEQDFRTVTSPDPLVYLDAGARGGLQGLWRKADDGRIRVIAFEPDGAAADDLAAAPSGNRVVIAKGLWNRECELDLHIAEEASASSIHAPNWDLLARFRRQHADPRRTTRTQRVQCTTVDKVADEIGIAIDFAKLDTQGGEYEILEGAEQQLRRNVFGVVCETWTQEVHKGQRLTHEVWAYLDKLGFEVVEVAVAAAWQHRNVDATQLAGRAHLTGLDLLAFKRPEHWGPMSHTRAVKCAAIAELYGFPDIALELLESAQTVTDVERRQAIAFCETIRRTAIPPSTESGGFLARLMQRWRARDRDGQAKLHY